MIGPTIIHHQKTEDVFDIGLHAITRKADLMSSEFGMITDGETALVKACRTNFPKSKDLRCTNHVKENRERWREKSSSTKSSPPI